MTLYEKLDIEDTRLGNFQNDARIESPADSVYRSRSCAGELPIPVHTVLQNSENPERTPHLGAVHTIMNDFI